MAEQPVVSVVRAGADKAAAIARAIGLAGLSGAFEPGQRVTLKPNWHGSDGYTSPAVVVAMAAYARDHGASEIVVGDGPFYGKPSAEFADYVERMGVRDQLLMLGARVVNFHDQPYAVRRGLSPDLPAETGFSAHVVDADVLVSLPVMKTHFGTLVTLGIKNLKGCLRPEDKARLHTMELHAALVAINDVLRPTVHLMDATTAYEGLGPSHGAPVEMGLVLCSADVVALDTVAAYLMGLEPQRVKLIQMAWRAGLGPASLDAIEVRGERLDEHRRRFELPFEAFQRQYPQLRLRHDHACSGCLGNVFSALAFATKPIREDYPAVCLGRTEAPEPEALLVGDCAIRSAAGHPAVPGCPPSIADIIAALTSQEG